MLSGLFSKLASSALQNYGMKEKRRQDQSREKALSAVKTGSFTQCKEHFTVGVADAGVLTVLLVGAAFLLVAVVRIGGILLNYFAFQEAFDPVSMVTFGLIGMVGAVILVVAAVLSKRRSILHVDDCELTYGRKLMLAMEVRCIREKGDHIQIIDDLGEVFFSCSKDFKGVLDLYVWAKANHISIEDF